MCHQSTKLNNCMRRASRNLSNHDSSDDDCADDEGEARCTKPVFRLGPNQTRHLRPLCPTRVLCRGPSVRAVLSDLERTLDALQQYSDESNGEAAARAR